jgi:hypothetical protein
MDLRRRSALVMLTAIGVPLAVVVAEPLLSRASQQQRNLYSDRAACERDYPANQCEPHNSSSGYSGSWHGPYYTADRGAPAARSDSGPGRSGVHAAVETSSRGGFGAFGRAMHAVS